jgi:hypothetical protein
MEVWILKPVALISQSSTAILEAQNKRKISYSQTNKCTTITNIVYLASPTYVLATNLPSSRSRPKNHNYSLVCPLRMAN